MIFGMSKKRGSLSVEAVISFTVFLSVSFLLLTIVKLVLVMIILNNATTETAKTIATSAYPINILNVKQKELEDKLEEYEKAVPTKLSDSLQTASDNPVLNAFFSGDGADASETGSGSLEEFISGMADKLAWQPAYALKGRLVTWLCGKVVQGYTTDCGIQIDPSKLMLRAVKIPQTDTEFTKVYAGGLALSERPNGLVAQPCSSAHGTDGDFNADDVLICLEYPYEISLPLIPTIKLTLRSVSVEHAWLHGTGCHTERKEGIQIGKALYGDAERVYIATGGYGEKYHLRGCSKLWDSNTAIRKDLAKEQGFQPCKSCKPG